MMNRKTLLKIGEFAKQNKRSPPKEFESILLKLCHGHCLTRRQLSELLRRNAKGLLSRFFTPMVGNGLLRLRHPKKPNRADLAYTSNIRSD